MRALILVVALAVMTTLAAECRAGILIATTKLDGPSEFPPVASPGEGFAKVIFDTDAHTLRVIISFRKLLGVITVAHIHARVSPSADPPVVGVATTVPTFPGFPTGVTKGFYDRTFDTTLASTFNPAFINANGGTPAGAEAALFAAIEAGEAYVNLHTNLFPAGEIRGFLNPIPEPASVVLFLLGTVGVAGWVRRRRASGATNRKA